MGGEIGPGELKQVRGSHCRCPPSCYFARLVSVSSSLFIIAMNSRILCKPLLAQTRLVQVYNRQADCYVNRQQATGQSQHQLQVYNSPAVASETHRIHGYARHILSPHRLSIFKSLARQRPRLVTRSIHGYSQKPGAYGVEVILSTLYLSHNGSRFRLVNRVRCHRIAYDNDTQAALK